MSKTAIMEALKNSLGETLNEEVSNQISGYLDQLVSDRTSASTLELTEKVSKLVKENKLLRDSIKKQEHEFKCEAERFATELAEAFAQKESILFEEVENYKKETVKVVEEVSKEYRNEVETMVMEEFQEARQIMIDEAKNFRLSQEAALAEDVKAYQTDLLEKLDQFLEAEIPNNIPEGIMEAVAKNKALEEIVEGVMNVFSEKSIRLDEASEKVLKDARKEYEHLAESYNAKVKEAVSLTAKVRELDKENKISQLTEGMTIAQKKTARKLLESATSSDVEKRFESIKDLIIKESVKPSTTHTIHESNKVVDKQQSKVVEKQIFNLRESVKPAPKKVSGLEAEMESWKKQVDRSFKRF
jgi:hypothetical protein